MQHHPQMMAQAPQRYAPPGYGQPMDQQQMMMQQQMHQQQQPRYVAMQPGQQPPRGPPMRGAYPQPDSRALKGFYEVSQHSVPGISESAQR